MGGLDRGRRHAMMGTQHSHIKHGLNITVYSRDFIHTYPQPRLPHHINLCTFPPSNNAPSALLQ